MHSYPIQIVQNWYHCKILKNYRLRGLDLTINSKQFWEGSICGGVLQFACRIELEMYLFDFYQKNCGPSCTLLQNNAGSFAPHALTNGTHFW